MTRIQDLVDLNHAPHSSRRVVVKDRSRKDLAVISPNEWKVLYDASCDVTNKMVQCFCEACNFCEFQSGDLVSPELSDTLRESDRDGAVEWLEQAFKYDEKTTNRFLVIPLVDNGFWVVVRVDRVHSKVIIADPRELVIKKRHPLVGPLVDALKTAMNRAWKIDVLGADRLPQTAQKSYSAILACLNIACWALFTNKRQREDQNYVEVFTYSTDSYFMQKARHFISRVILSLIHI